MCVCRHRIAVPGSRVRGPDHGAQDLVDIRSGIIELHGSARRRDRSAHFIAGMPKRLKGQRRPGAAEATGKIILTKITA
jgi:hypothetical protein